MPLRMWQKSFVSTKLFPSTYSVVTSLSDFTERSPFSLNYLLTCWCTSRHPNDPIAVALMQPGIARRRRGDPPRGFQLRVGSLARGRSARRAWAATFKISLATNRASRRSLLRPTCGDAVRSKGRRLGVGIARSLPRRPGCLHKFDLDRRAVVPGRSDGAVHGTATEHTCISGCLSAEQTLA